MLNFIPESQKYISHSLATYSNNLVRSVITAASRSTQTSTSRSTATTATTITPTEPLEQCCICLTDITRGEIDLHQNNHRIHVRCLMHLLANSQIIWSERLFCFNVRYVDLQFWDRLGCLHNSPSYYFKN